MLTTITTKQARVLSILAPGTVALRDEQLHGAVTAIVSVDDTARSGIWLLIVQANGDVRIRYTYGAGGQHDDLTYAEVVAREHEAANEGAAWFADEA
jgi:hypothetical protein